jgi:translation elongation factor EF-G
MKEKVKRVGDMHPNRALEIHVQPDGDIVIFITQDRMPIGDTDFGDPRTRAAQVEFCLSGGRSHHTRQALFALIEAMKKDEAERPIVP